ncbi:myb family transcription factor EFM-like isoform X2 [Trifolium pratense]|uniref:myb family transcription factor EFM-like isoform X2 n=1 Tax=Trifolium pratense TaxID=57577 RepID=UPI001E6911BE|nr:myb family transcription factor EFM-like isoform X2 [Trifolium pratense]
MGCVVPSELSLDLRPAFVPKTIANFLYHLSTLQNTSDKLSKLHDFVSRFEEELNKIQAFKRELPLCMLLLIDAISVLKEELEKCRTQNSVPVLEEFIPLKKEIDQSQENNNNDDRENNNNNECRDKKNWMSSVQLWNNNTTTINNNVVDHDKHNNNHNKLETKKRDEEGQSMTIAEETFQSCSSNRNGGSAFMPFSTYSSVPVTTVKLSAPKEEKEETVMNGFSLLSSGVKSLREGFGSKGSRSSSNRAVSSSPPTVQPSLRTPPLQPQQTSRKQRRCWSPELHRRFVNALQKLGGTQATPKQIRELMQVDGLTNDEVKSHLQKYRLHTRRVPATSGNESVVVLGGLWMSQEQYNDSSKGSSTASGSPQSPLHLATGSRGGTSPTEGDSMEDDEDAKSESYSWKSHIHRHGKVGV